MSDVIISAENIGKRYVLNHQAGGPGYTRFSESLAYWAKTPLRALQRSLSPSEPSPLNPQPSQEDFWALKDVSFEIKRGEVVGIIGRNGAGKSTLLKILSRITEPTKGRITLKGRVASLLEVGTGFHPELTGRENIYLNGAILGMTKAEIRSKFDEIVAFAEIEKFLDTPVKRYSSGMYVRLAFAVAAHLEPEILIVDEVLAVGDANFQRKCLNRMEKVGSEGRTVLYVSHNMPSVMRLCSRAILLNAGQVLDDGPCSKVTSIYLQSGVNSGAERNWTDVNTAPGNDVARLRAVRVLNDVGEISPTLDIRKPISIEMEFDVIKADRVLVPNFHLVNEDGIIIFIALEQDPVWHRKPRPIGCYRCRMQIPGNFLAEGTMLVGAALSTHNPVIVHFFERDAVSFQVQESTEGGSARGDYGGPFPGVVRPLLEWTTEELG